MKQTEILLTVKLHQELFIDPKRVRLLKEIKECGSINQAAKMPMSVIKVLGITLKR